VSVRRDGLLFPLVLPLLLGGCLYVGGHAAIGPRWDPAVPRQIVPGRSTKADVLALLGPPNEYTRPELVAALADDRARLSGALALANRSHDVFTWQYDEVDLDGTVLLLFNAFAAEAVSDLLVVFFDEYGVVTDVAVRSITGAP
jgi:hypothetical protein